MATLQKHGILPYQHLENLICEGTIQADLTIEKHQIQPASLDLRLGTKAYRLRGSFFPENSEVRSELKLRDLYEAGLLMYDFDLSNGAILEKGHVYLVPLMERLKLPKSLRGRTNPKSSTGRLDIFTRVITDLNFGFDDIRPGYKGPLYLEIVSRSFTINVKTGMSLTQLRLMDERSTLTDDEIFDLHEKDCLLYDFDPQTGDYQKVQRKKLRINEGLFLRVDLHGPPFPSGNPIVGYRAKRNSQVIDLSMIGYYPPLDYWEPIPMGLNTSLLLEPEEFYILASKEKIRIPAGYSAEMVAYDAACGELRTHYAGFFDPGFGYGNGEIAGTPIVLEVRPHDVPFLVRHGQTFFKVVYEKMLETPSQVYGTALGSSYHQQGLTLSKHFK